MAAIRPGLAAADLEALGGRIDDAGLSIVDDLVHGYVGGYLPPVVRTPLTRQGAPPNLVLQPGMCLVVQPDVVLKTLWKRGDLHAHQPPLDFN